MTGVQTCALPILGILFHTILVDQFRRLRDGDRFFHLNDTFTSAEQSLVGQGNTLAKVIKLNTSITNLQQNVFKFTSTISGKVYLAHNANAQGGPGLAGVTVQLRDEDGNVVATMVTGAQGHYSFNEQSGPADPGDHPGISSTGVDRKSTRLNSSHRSLSRMPSSA